MHGRRTNWDENAATSSFRQILTQDSLSVDPSIVKQLLTKITCVTL